MVLQLLHLIFLHQQPALPATSVTLPNNLILCFKESELSAVKSATASSSGGSSLLY